VIILHNSLFYFIFLFLNLWLFFLYFLRLLDWWLVFFK